MEKTKVTEEIRAFGKNIFRNMHERFGFDFEKNIGIFRLDGKFTVASIRKFCLEHGFSKNATCLVLCSNGYRANKYAKDGNNGWAFSPVLLNFRDCTFETVTVMYLSTYYRKSDFTDDRSMYDAIAYVIVQNMEHLESCGKRNEDLLQRFKLEEVKRFYGEEEIMSLILRDMSGRKVDYWCGGFTFGHITSPTEVMDGSGYLVVEHRNALQARLKALKERRAKEAYSAMDYTVKVATIDALCEAAKSVLVVALQDAKDSDAVQEVGRKLGNLTYIMNRAEWFKQKTAEKSFRSIEESENAYNYILSSLIK